MMRSNYHFKFPCRFDLLNGEKKVASVVAQSMVMDNNSIVKTMRGAVDYDFSRISLQLSNSVEKSLIEGRHDAYLLEVNSD